MTTKNLTQDCNDAVKNNRWAVDFVTECPLTSDHSPRTTYGKGRSFQYSLTCKRVMVMCEDGDCKYVACGVEAKMDLDDEGTMLKEELDDEGAMLKEKLDDEEAMLKEEPADK
ncbi:hypothetical protein L2E82_38970 [Cichorium intybus]|uniref:Uncharacterized protein n=1 Tax=Cichorium intybus TaxID=13427 RepID=A0ACB9AI74_CICIN|nr:hypothetical protein L2E82_38970 [Cichorium intybus]